MILLADSGSTKTDWSLIHQNLVVARFKTTGMNPFFITPQEVTDEMVTHFPKNREKALVRQILFFGAGCSSTARNAVISSGLERVFPKAGIQVRTDLEAAALAFFPEGEGIVAILGTGSNSAWVKNGSIYENRRSWGYILGDEGSANHIGRLFVRAYLNDDLSVNMARKIEEDHNLSKDKILEGVYRGKFPNRYLASMASIAHEYVELGMIRELVKSAFRDFFVWHLSHYSSFPALPLRVCGSTAYGFQQILKDVSREFGARLERIEKSPIAGLEKWGLSR